jgi:hypothetical protein
VKDVVEDEIKSSLRSMKDKVLLAHLYIYSPASTAIPPETRPLTRSSALLSIQYSEDTCTATHLAQLDEHLLLLLAISAAKALSILVRSGIRMETLRRPDASVHLDDRPGGAATLDCEASEVVVA